MKLGLYRHYKGNLYHVLGMCRHSETLETLVMYQSLYGDFGYWVRPKEVFESTVTIDGHEEPRFKFVRSVTEQPPELR